MGNITFLGKNGVSTIDYIICDQKLFEKFKFFMVKQPTYLSDHSQITAWFSIPKNPNSTESENPELPPLKELPQQFIWSETSSVLFKNELNSQNIQDLVNEFLNQEFEKTDRGVNAAASKVENILYSAAKNSLKRKNARRRFTITKHINKKWFDKDCRLKRHQVRKLANLKRKDPLNESIRYEFHKVLKEYRNLLKNKQQTYKNEKLTELSNFDVHSQTFWKTFKTLPETETETPAPPIDQNEWLRHFGKLHSVPNTEHSLQQSILNELQNMENSKAKLNTLDYPVTFQEVRNTVKKLKNKKAASSDLIKK